MNSTISRCTGRSVETELEFLPWFHLRLSLKLAPPFLLGRDSNIQLVNKFFICNPWIVQLRAQFVSARSEASVMAQTISPNMVISWARGSGGLINFVKPKKKCPLVGQSMQVSIKGLKIFANALVTA